MATPKTKKPAPNNFGSLTSNIIGGVTPPAEPKVTTVKDRVTSFELKGELRKPLDRLVHGLGRKASIRSVINMALAYYFENEPRAMLLAATPTPEEESNAEGQD
jgi:hypothetical protein